ncbi:uncharacterized protein LOC125503636 isoform X3 [Dendroctonus ponderosae]|uniref:uncharacterized protein LOC125503636 isoform X3 n=1 Tax=Dendroctonus ponderosae TaxID=77166 RepID=UPI002035EC79|nr:uncharacterized protein LOC125503636 isoform X3 [Dendroctonus ponderosae]
MAGSKETKKRYQDLGCYFRFTETCLDIYKYKMVYFSAIANCCSYTLAGIGLVAYGFRTGFEKFCLDYGLLVIMMVVYNCHITICLIYHKKWKAMRQQFVAGFSWNLDNFAPSYRMEILRISSGNEESTKLVGLATALITISIQVDFYSSIKEIILYFGIPEHFIPIILVGIYTHIVYMSLSSVMATYYIFYFLWLIRIQQVVLRSMADKFRSNILLNRSDNFVEDALKSIIKSHQTIIRPQEWHTLCSTYLEQLLISKLSLLISFVTVAEKSRSLSTFTKIKFTFKFQLVNGWASNEFQVDLNLYPYNSERFSSFSR